MGDVYSTRAVLTALHTQKVAHASWWCRVVLCQQAVTGGNGHREEHSFDGHTGLTASHCSRRVEERERESAPVGALKFAPNWCICNSVVCLLKGQSCLALSPYWCPSGGPQAVYQVSPLAEREHAPLCTLQTTLWAQAHKD